MESKKKNILLGVLIVGVIAMTVAFAALSTNLRINGSANVAATSWNIHFYNWQKVDLAQGTTGHTNTAVYPAVNQLSTSDSTNITKVEGVNVTLNQPGDVAKYTFEIVNDGSITARLSNFEANLTPSSNVIGYEVKCFESNTRTGTEVEYNSTLAANGGKAYCYLQVEYNDVTNAQVAGSSQVYTQSAVNTSLSATWTWIQDNGSLVIPWSERVGNKTEGFTTFKTSTQSSGSTLPDETQFWVQSNTTTKEVCGVFANNAVCLTNSSNGYSVGGEYALQKKAEMESAGAECTDDSTSMKCIGSGVYCSVSIYGSVFCGKSDYSKYCYVTDNGSGICN